MYYRKHHKLPPNEQDEERRFTLDEVCLHLFLMSIILVFLASKSINLVSSLLRGISLKVTADFSLPFETFVYRMKLDNGFQ